MRRLKPRNYVAVSAGNYPWIPVDSHAGDFRIGWAAFHNGTGQITSAHVDGTYVDVLSVAGSAAAFPLVTAHASTGLVVDGEITQPVMAIRYRVAAVSGSANVTFNVMLAD